TPALLATTCTTRASSRPSAMRSRKFWSVVPEPEISTARRIGVVMSLGVREPERNAACRVTEASAAAKRNRHGASILARIGVLRNCPRGPGHAVRESGHAGRFPRAGARRARLLAAHQRVRPPPRPEPRQAEVVLPRRPDYRQQSDGRPPRLGPHLQGRLPALLRHDRPRGALPERLRLPGLVGGSGSREGTRPEVQA